MITKVTHMCIYVLNQESAYDFYVKKLGFKVHTDAPMGEDGRWLTVCPPEQPGLEITLILVAEGNVFTKETVKTMTELTVTAYLSALRHRRCATHEYFIWSLTLQ